MVFLKVKNLLPKISPDSKKPAFTLVELLVVTAIFAGLGVLLVNSLFAVLRSNAKSEIMKEIRQSGSFALDVMTKKLTGGSNISCPSSVRVRFNDVGGEQIDFVCFSDDYIASQSGSVTTPLTSRGKTRVESCSFACSPVGFYTRVTINFVLTQAGASSRQEDLARQSFNKVVLVRNR